MMITVDFTNNITEIHDYAFANNNIESIELSNNLIKLGPIEDIIKNEYKNLHF